MIEEWRSIKDFEGLYEVSNLGRIRSLERIVSDKNGKRTRIFKGRILSDICSSTGYHFVSLHKNLKRVARRTVHRLVMETFHPNENTLEIVDHINGIRDDNRLENLRWTSYTTNNRNTPYIRYLQGLLKKNKIYYVGEQDWK